MEPSGKENTVDRGVPYAPAFVGTHAACVAYTQEKTGYISILKFYKNVACKFKIVLFI
jgi:hypothetical protein